MGCDLHTPVPAPKSYTHFLTNPQIGPCRSSSFATCHLLLAWFIWGEAYVIVYYSMYYYSIVCHLMSYHQVTLCYITKALGHAEGGFVPGGVPEHMSRPVEHPRADEQQIISQIQTGDVRCGLNSVFIHVCIHIYVYIYIYIYIYYYY